MSKPLAYGIDFGTTNSAISVAYSDSAEMVPLRRGGGFMMPSMVYLDETGNHLVGEDAIQTYLVRAGRGGRLISSLKSFLTDESFTSTIGPDGRTHTLEDLVAILLRALKRQADRELGSSVDRVVIGHPVVFVGAEGPGFAKRQARAEERLQRAAERAGFREVVLFDESSAALEGEPMNNGMLMSVDFGGGTFDVSVMAVTPTSWPVVATEGAAIGGERFDALLFDAKVAEPLGLKGAYPHGMSRKYIDVPSNLRRMRTLNGILTMSAEGRAGVVLESWRDELPVVHEIINGGHAWEFYRAIESAKIALSDQAKSVITFARRGTTISLHEDVTRDEFDGIIGRDLDVIDTTIDRALDHASCSAADIDLVVCTGGSSQVPAFVERLSRRFGAEKVEERDAFYTVALGLGLKASELWGGT